MMKAQLLSHAETLVRERGFDAFSYADLAKGAEITKASVHHHFPTKAALSLALVQRYADRTLAHMRKADDDPAPNRLRHILMLYRDALAGGGRLCLCVSLTASRASLSPDTCQAIAQYQADVLDWLRILFDDARAEGSLGAVTDPKAEAAACFATLEGAQLSARAAGDLNAYDDATALLWARTTPKDTP